MLIVDAANVVGSRPDGWWRDRAGAAARLVSAVRAAVDSGRLAPPVVVVLEGAARAGSPADGAAGADGVRVVHAPGEGDETIARLATEAASAGGTGTVTVVSADRALAARVRAAGAGVARPRWLLGLLAP